MRIYTLCFSFPLENWRPTALWLPLSHKSQGFFLWLKLKEPAYYYPSLLLFFWRVLIGSPLTGQPAKRTGDVYRCPVGQNRNSSCEKFQLSGEKSLGYCIFWRHSYFCRFSVYSLSVVFYGLLTVCICVCPWIARKPVTGRSNRHYLNWPEIVSCFLN